MFFVNVIIITTVIVLITELNEKINHYLKNKKY